MKDTLQTIAGAIALLLALDAFAFFAWVFSGQNPADGYYFGAITAKIITTALTLF